MVADNSVPSGEDVEVGGDDFPWKRMDLFPVRVGVRDSHQRRASVLMAHADQRTVGRLEGELADARVFEQHPLLARAHVDGHEVAQCVVVVGVERGAASRIERERRDHVVQRAFDVGQALDAAVPRVERPNVLDDTGIPKGAVRMPVASS